jgi:hypothetical protein
VRREFLSLHTYSARSVSSDIVGVPASEREIALPPRRRASLIRRMASPFMGERWFGQRFAGAQSLSGPCRRAVFVVPIERRMIATGYQMLSLYSQSRMSVSGRRAESTKTQPSWHHR